MRKVFRALQIMSLAFLSRVAAQYCSVSGHGQYHRYINGTPCAVSCEFITCDDPSYNCYYCETLCYGGSIYTYTDCK
jgi:hypothetical protein